MTAYDKERLIHFSQEIFEQCNDYAFIKNNRKKNSIGLQECFSTYMQSLTTYHNTLTETRKIYNLIGPNENITDHIIDSLSALPIFIEVFLAQYPHYSPAHHTVHIADLGTGAGLPSIPLSTAFSYLSIPSKWYLLERSHKKATFLASVYKHIQSSLHPDIAIHIIEKNLKEWSPTQVFDIICLRAFHPIGEVLPDMKRISGNTPLLFYKGKRQAIDDEFSPLSPSPLTLKNVYQLFHEPNKERHIVYAQFSEQTQ